MGWNKDTVKKYQEGKYAAVKYDKIARTYSVKLNWNGRGYSEKADSGPLVSMKRV